MKYTQILLALALSLCVIQAEIVQLGQISGQSNLNTWGNRNADGSVQIWVQGVKGRISAYDSEGAQAEVGWAHNGLGVKGDVSQEIELGETVSFEFQTGQSQTLSDVTVGFDSLYGNYNAGSNPDARVIWTASYQDEEPRSGELQSDASNSDGDNKKETNSVFIEGPFDSLSFTTESPNGINSNFVIRYMQFDVQQPDCLELETCDLVTLGTVEGEGSVDAWGTLNRGQIEIDQGRIQGSIYVSGPNGEEAAVAFEHNGLGSDGGQTNELDIGETLVLLLENNACYFDAEVGFDSLYGHFDEGSNPDARVRWTASYNGQRVREGEIQSDQDNADGDNNSATNQIYIEGKFNKLEFSAYSPSGINSNFVVRYITFKTSWCCQESGQSCPFNGQNGEVVILGGSGLDSWGETNDDGVLEFSQQGVSGTITALDADENPASITYAHDGLGIEGRSNEIDLGESLTFNFETNGDCLFDAVLRLDSLYGHYDEGSKQDARVIWEASFQGENIRNGEVQNDQDNEDGDNQRETVSINIPGKFDRLYVSTYSPANINSNFVVSSLEFSSSYCCREACEFSFENAEYISLGRRDDEGAGSLEYWGFTNEDGTLSIQQFGASGLIIGYDEDGNQAELVTSHQGVGIKGDSSNEIDLGESIVIYFDQQPGCTFFAEVGFDSLYGHFAAGSKPDARVVWESSLQGEVQRSGQVQQDSQNSDGDGRKETKTILIEGKFDTLTFWVESPSNTQSNFVLRYLDFFSSQCCLESSECVQNVVELGQESGKSSIESWGVYNEDGSLSIETLFDVNGTITAFDKEGNQSEVGFAYNGLGVKGDVSQEVELGEALVIDLDPEFCYSQPTAGFDSLGGHYNPGSGPDARVTWEAFLNGESVGSGEIQADVNNSDGDGNRLTNRIDFDGDFNRLVFSTYSPNDINSNFVLRFLDFLAGPCCEPQSTEVKSATHLTVNQ